jgi:hypothetical protein
MNRLRFFNLAGSIVAGVALGLHCKLTNVVAARYKPNPAYIDAPMEKAFMLTPTFIYPIIYKRELATKPGFEADIKKTFNEKISNAVNPLFYKDPMPFRYDHEGNSIEPYILG